MPGAGSHKIRMGLRVSSKPPNRPLVLHPAGILMVKCQRVGHWYGALPESLGLSADLRWLQRRLQELFSARLNLFDLDFTERRQAYIFRLTPHGAGL